MKSRQKKGLNHSFSSALSVIVVVVYSESADELKIEL